MSNEEIEVWKNVLDDNFKDYQVSNLGRIKNTKKFLTPDDTNRISYKSNKLIVHIAIATCFVYNDDPENKRDVYHIKK